MGEEDGLQYNCQLLCFILRLNLVGSGRVYTRTMDVRTHVPDHTAVLLLKT